ncbi:amino acid ABC transporter substrate-binding protein [Desulfopila sp. IMCC35006]|uniref:amino acid ABC transporter substrate-binding protein n=1 Tax=Desulfopila sp. IMCC35006 TaxID=2569542 RepID=UPI0010AD0AA1|nr:amino acid ABC transporter substrate-binding protein [Desulfopila sp. IMCC35006]TKB26922.1 amino acid ABC transporter substrate-binding protein [Desulfopila sp. IMCC35006]
MTKNSCLAALLAIVFFAGMAQAYTREEVIKRGFVLCGVSTGSPGFSSVDALGKWTGLDVDICRAVAAATLGDAKKVECIPLAENESFTALLTGKIDILSRHSTWTFTRDSALPIHFAGISYYDGQGVLISKKLNIQHLADLRQVKLCSPVDTDFEPHIIDYLTRNNIEYSIVPYDTVDLAVKGFDREDCDMLTMQQSQLYGIRLGLANPDGAQVLPEVIAKDPLGPVVRQGDDTWLNIVRWSLYAMVNSEELGITSGNLDEMKLSDILAVKRLLGREGAGGRGIGLKNDWALQIIRQVGNYGEVFERNVGSMSVLKIERGMNNLWTRGGLQYAPPLQ